MIWLRKHWKFLMAALLVFLATLAVGLTVFFAPLGIPLLAAVGFGFVNTVSPIWAAIIMACITATVTIVALVLFNIIYSTTRALDRRAEEKGGFFKHWKALSAVGIALGLGLTAGLMMAFFPPAIPFFASFSFLGVVPFGPGLAATALSTVATVAGAAVALAVTVWAVLHNMAYYVTRFIDNKINPDYRYKQIPDLDDELGIEDFDNELDSKERDQATVLTDTVVKSDALKKLEQHKKPRPNIPLASAGKEEEGKSSEKLFSRKKISSNIPIVKAAKEEKEKQVPKKDSSESFFSSPKLSPSILRVRAENAEKENALI